MKIAVIGPLEFPGRQGGMTRHIEEVYARIAADGHEVTVFCRRALEASARLPRDASPDGAGDPREPVGSPQLQRDRVHDRCHVDTVRRRALPLVLELRLVLPAPRRGHEGAHDGAPARVARREVGRCRAGQFSRRTRGSRTASPSAFIAVSRDFEDFLRQHVKGERPIVRIPNGVTMPDEIDDDAAEHLGLDARRVPARGEPARSREGSRRAARRARPRRHDVGVRLSRWRSRGKRGIRPTTRVRSKRAWHARRTCGPPARGAADRSRARSLPERTRTRRAVTRARATRSR